MDQRIHWLKCGDKKILVSDYSGLTTEELMEYFSKSNEVVLQSKEKVLLLTDFSNTKIDKVIIQRLKDAEAKKVAMNVRRTAVLGITGIKRQILNFYNAATGSNARAFSTRKEAIYWLLKAMTRNRPEFSSIIEDKNKTL
ncbi:MAG: hypothetical protein JW969_15320 [Spirochaetales bacterium]|nr:hypothetical protein [Spirochaetales bacterium]